MTWSISILLASTVLLAVLLWKEWTRVNRSRRMLRLLATIVSVSALAGLAVSVVLPGTEILVAANKVIIVTEGADADSLAGFQGLPMVTTDRSQVARYPKCNLRYVADLDEFIARHPATEFHIVGYGIGPEEQQALRGQKTVFHPAKLPAGITSLSQNGPLRPGEALAVTGTYSHPSGEAVTLELRGLNTVLDSTVILANGRQTFRLTTVPRHLGQVTYTLTAHIRGRVIASEVLPVSVLERQPIRLLLLTATPDFETKFLKNWLYQHGYALSIRSRISKDKSTQEFLNADKQSLDRISASLLEKFDLVLADAATINTLPLTESRALEAEVKTGLGLLVRHDTIGRAVSPLLRRFTTYSPLADSQKVVRVHLPSGGSMRLNTPAPVFLRQPLTGQTLLRDDRQRILANTLLSGRGKLVYSTLPDTWPLALAGDSSSYGALWSTLIEKAARKQPANTERLTDPSVRPGERADLLVASREAVSDELSGKPVQQDPVFLQRIRISTWPLQSGWVGKNWFVETENGWKTRRATDLRRQTDFFIQKNQAGDAQPGEQRQKSAIPLPPAYFFMLFVLAAGYLWYEKKLI